MENTSKTESMSIMDEDFRFYKVKQKLFTYFFFLRRKLWRVGVEGNCISERGNKNAFTPSAKRGFSKNRIVKAGTKKKIKIK